MFFCNPNKAVQNGAPDRHICAQPDIKHHAHACSVSPDERKRAQLCQQRPPCRRGAGPRSSSAPSRAMQMPAMVAKRLGAFLPCWACGAAILLTF